MDRISKPPEIRKQEILDTAMKLFYEKGYEATSMADIAKELNIVQGLCYRYFKSKQILFETAMNQYVEICCAKFVQNIHDHSRSINERLNIMEELMINAENKGEYREFYHKPGNEAMHEMLSFKMCKYMLPHIKEEIKYLKNTGVISIEDPELAAEFISYGQIGLLQNKSEPFSVITQQIKKYVNDILKFEDK
ncbi:TetR/AcrR family transcriptional regulator [Clostridium beijerinckii]|jgi:transcriptional regulator, TetR family|uniref:TetR/AcrR family transcriptional regulator n=2 Tax=Clostridium beijerinckii TaxID=1520 RepID=A0AAE2UWI7_CLOBE|nr:TetR/AcrR family transcriptional regulator [Clostridium beijerinckii]ABR35279.1 transcriptional regulator, TetR family [Clostridium beijerinckii NCIMB 8052]AIU03670.1 TetR family transcriptional regulator [Clostridium beijerinckii ATCC 35702]MBF7810084.1 TetR/AcrR family transcriptional regulator [Clostridium beijerinckii]NRT23322.1 AcrR family transcriptional regulator [Clostridium beijerinckii]NRT69106.1 AcrR family transcriptional regulator [Clostridium beijerinckii]